MSLVTVNSYGSAGRKNIKKKLFAEDHGGPIPNKKSIKDEQEEPPKKLSKLDTELCWQKILYSFVLHVWFPCFILSK